jgi:hypothetical protein
VPGQAVLFSSGPAAPSAQSGHLLVYQDKSLFPALVQQFTVEFASSGVDRQAQQEECLLDLLYQGSHLLSKENGMTNSAN